MLKFDGKELRNLEEQVLKNQEDIENLKTSSNLAELGIKIITETPFASESDLPLPYDGDYGDGFLVGSEAPYTLYVWTRGDNEYNGTWFDFGPLNAPSVIPGPVGPQGIQGQQGTRGSLWNSQSGIPTQAAGVNNNDQALNTLTGDVYQYNNGVWQLTGNIRGPQGVQGIRGLQGVQGIPGPVGPQGPKGDQGQFIQIIGTLQNTDQLPAPDSVPRYSAYLIPVGGDDHIFLIVGDETLAWHDAGVSGGGSTVTIDGVNQPQLEIGSVAKIGASYAVGENTQVSAIEDKVTFSNLQATGYNVNNQSIIGTGSIELPIASSDDIAFEVTNNTLQASLTQDAWDRIDDAITDAQPQEVQISAPTTATNGQLSEEQMSILQANKGAYLLFNSEIFRLQDTQREAGYLVYTHAGYMNTTATYSIKCISVQISTRTWVLTEQAVADKNAVVTLTGNQTINGDKTFNDEVEVFGDLLANNDASVAGDLSVGGHISNMYLDYQLDQTISVNGQNNVFIPVDFNNYDYKLCMWLSASTNEQNIHNTCLFTADNYVLRTSSSRWVYTGVDAFEGNTNPNATNWCYQSEEHGYMYLTDNENNANRYVRINVEMYHTGGTTIDYQCLSSRIYADNFVIKDSAGIIYDSGYNTLPTQLCVWSSEKTDTQYYNGHIRVYKRPKFHG